MERGRIVPRLLEGALARTLEIMPVGVLTGARQTGKSTLARTSVAVGERTYLSLDDLTVLDRARRAPEAVVREDARLTLDEVQRAPDLLLAVKRVVDEQPAAGRFLLTGSANLLLLERISESLAGRAVYLTLWPLTRREQLGLASAGVWTELLEAEPASWRDLIEAQDVPPEPWEDLARRGGYPPAALRLADADSRRVWFEGYATTYLERDVRLLSVVDRLTEFRRLMAAICLRLGGIQNQSEIARDVALPPSTAQRYLNLLEVTFQLVRVPAFAVNRTKRLVKSPKLYWSDTGLALHLCGEPTVRGAHLENVVLTDLLAWRGARTDRADVLYWRTTKGAEVDFVIETPRRVLPLEVKATGHVRTADAAHLETFLDEYPDLASSAVIVYTGRETFWLTRRVLVAPWWHVI